MPCKIAVAGTGAIGAMMGGWLTRSGYDVTMLSLYRAEQARRLNRDGLTLVGYGPEFQTPVRAELLAQLPASEQFDFIFLTMKSNALAETLSALAAHLKPEGALIPMQNGINDVLLEQAVPRRQIVTCVTFAGGAQLAPGRFMNHDGHFYLGGTEDTPSELVRQAADIAGHVRPTEITSNIRAFQWDKLSRVCLSVPTACISGLFLGDVFLHPETQRLFAALALELFAVAEADGCPRQTVEEKTRAEWQAVLDGRSTGLECAEKFKPWPPGIVDAYTADIRKGLPLEIDFTNGVVIDLGMRYHVPTPANQAVLRAVHTVERGEEQAGLDLLRRVCAAI